MCIPNRHFPTWKIKVLPPVTFPAAPRLFPNPEHLQPPDSADRLRQRPRDQLFILCVGICIPYPAAHETTIYFLTPLAESIPGGMDLLGLCAQIDSFCQCEGPSQPNIRTPYFPILQAEQDRPSIAQSEWQRISTAFMEFQNVSCTSHCGV
jgi:hypothetical protein